LRLSCVPSTRFRAHRRMTKPFLILLTLALMTGAASAQQRTF
jgi:hypothetical protein